MMEIVSETQLFYTLIGRISERRKWMNYESEFLYRLNQFRDLCKVKVDFNLFMNRAASTTPVAPSWPKRQEKPNDQPTQLVMN